MITNDPKTRGTIAADYDPYDALVSIRKDAEWRASACPRRHRDQLDRCTGSEWKNALGWLENGLGTGITVVLCGPRGVGKTQLAVATVSRAIENAVHAEYETESQGRTDWGKVALFCELRDLFSDFKDNFRNGRSERVVIEKYVRPQLLILDELTVRNESEWEHDTLLSIVNKRYNLKYDTLFIGNCDETEISQFLGPSVASRIAETGGILACRWASYR